MESSAVENNHKRLFVNGRKNNNNSKKYISQIRKNNSGTEWMENLAVVIYLWNSAG